MLNSKSTNFSQHTSNVWIICLALHVYIRVITMCQQPVRIRKIFVYYIAPICLVDNACNIMFLYQLITLTILVFFWRVLYICTISLKYFILYIIYCMTLQKNQPFHSSFYAFIIGYRKSSFSAKKPAHIRNIHISVELLKLVFLINSIFISPNIITHICYYIKQTGMLTQPTLIYLWM